MNHLGYRNIVVRCVARRDGDQWVALCVDFDLAAQADSLSEVKAKLHNQISTYIREALTVDSKHAEQLLSRRAPLIYRARFEFEYALERLARLVGAVTKLEAYKEEVSGMPACA